MQFEMMALKNIISFMDVSKVFGAKDYWVV